MSLKENNEITVKIKTKTEELYKILEGKGFNINNIFSMKDSYFIPQYLNLNDMSTREILSKAVLVREIKGKTSGKITKKITYKIKKFDEQGNILSQGAINCEIVDIEEAKNLLEAIDYKEIMHIKENDIVYEKNEFQLAIKDIDGGEKLIEVETQENEELNTVDKLIQKINKLNIPIYTDNYFVKKAEIELNKILKR